MDDSELHHTHPWEARFFVGFLIMILGFIGLVLTDMKQDLAWHYWRALTVINAILCLWLSWYTQRKKHIVTISLFWREACSLDRTAFVGLHDLGICRHRGHESLFS